MGAPDERGFWPILLAAIATGVALTRDRHRSCDALLASMAQPIVMLMIMAWLLAGVLSTLLGASGFVEALIWIARQGGMSGGADPAMLIGAILGGATFGDSITVCTWPFLLPYFLPTILSSNATASGGEPVRRASGGRS